jgi:hypothetical protein
MKIKFKVYRELDTRFKKGFLFFPKTINDELRWLEVAVWKQMYSTCKSPTSLSWEDLQWVNDDTQTSN